MDIAIIMEFFKWCSIINISILILITIILPLLSNFAYSFHSKYWFSGSKEEHAQIIFKFLANYKIIIIVFNLVPYFALCIMRG